MDARSVVGAVAGMATGTLSGCLWISRAEHQARFDGDGDGVVLGIDCDDHDPDRYPGRDERPCDHVDNDCEPSTPDGPAFIELEDRVLTFGTLQEAIDASYADGTVGLCPGTIVEHVSVWVAGLDIAGQLDPRSTVIDGTGYDGPTVEVLAPDVRLVALGVTGGSGKPVDTVPGVRVGGRYGGGVVALDVAGLVLDNVAVFGNTADYGGGVAADALTVGEGTEVSGNSALRGGGLWLGLASAVTGARITENEADEGGGIAVEPAVALDLADTAVTVNHARVGAGIAASAGVVVSGGSLSGNVADEAGGGAWLDGAALVGVSVTDNTAPSGAGVYGHGKVDRGLVSTNAASGDGGGVHTDGDLEVIGTEVSQNRALRGAGLFAGAGTLSATYAVEGGVETLVLVEANAADGEGGGLCADGGALVVEHARVTGNTAQSGGGGALYGCEGCVHRFANASVDANHADRGGGGLWLDGAVAELTASDVVSNSVGAGDGGGLYATGGAAITVDNGHLDVNSAENGGALRLAGADVSVTGATLADGIATTRGGAALVTAGSLSLDAATVSRAFGAAIAIDGEGVFDANATTFDDNDVDIDVGGATCTVTGDTAAFTCAAGGAEPCTPPGACI